MIMTKHLLVIQVLSAAEYHVLVMDYRGGFNGAASLYYTMIEPHFKLDLNGLNNFLFT